ncbi:MAG: FAD-dependent monooxygenase, partial [Pseudomonadota bacterium]
MTTNECDVLISGGGIAGLSAAILFGRAGFDVICVDPVAPVTAPDEPGADLRTTAILQPAQALLDRAGIWSRLGGAPAPLHIMRIVEAKAASGQAPLTRDFAASDISDQPFGWNVPNWLLRREMMAHIASHDNVAFHPGTAVTSLFTRETEARVTLSNDRKVRTRLVVAADGRDSLVREKSGIAVTRLRYGQKALSFAVTHDAPHQNISTEIHRSGGPFTLVPLPDHEGRPCSAIVWMEAGPEVQRLANLPVGAFEAEMTERSGEIYGPLTLASPLSVWPIVSQLAERMWAQRVALIA